MGHDMEQKLSDQDMRVLWEMVVKTMAIQWLKTTILGRRIEILRDVRQMGIELEGKWVDLLLEEPYGAL